MATDNSAELRDLETAIQDSLLVVQQLFAERDEMRRRRTLYKGDSSDESPTEGFDLLRLDNKSADGTRDQNEPLERLFLLCAFVCPSKLKSLPERFDSFQRRPDLEWPYGTGGVRTSGNNGWADAFLIEARGLLEEAQDVVGDAVKKLPPLPPQSGEPAGQGIATPATPGADLPVVQVTPPAPLPVTEANEGASNVPADAGPKKGSRRERGPDLETCRQRVELEDKLIGELATIAERTKKYMTLDQLKKDTPDFELWKVMPSIQEQKNLLEEPFSPRVFARTLVKRKYGVTRDAIKKSRAKLRAAIK